VGHRRYKKGNQKVPENLMEITDLNVWDTAKAVLRGKFIAMNAYIKNTERFQTNNLTLHFTLRKTRTS
jgi:hypothetical protein